MYYNLLFCRFTISCHDFFFSMILRIRQELDWSLKSFSFLFHSKETSAIYNARPQYPWHIWRNSSALNSTCRQNTRFVAKEINFSIDLRCLDCYFHDDINSVIRKWHYFPVVSPFTDRYLSLRRAPEGFLHVNGHCLHLHVEKGMKEQVCRMHHARIPPPHISKGIYLFAKEGGGGPKSIVMNLTLWS